MGEMTSKERVFTALSFKEPDRVPVLHSITIYGAKLLNMSIKEYLSKPEHMFEGQISSAEKYENDFLIAFSSSAAEIEPMGGSVIYSEDGPPNSGEPFIKTDEHIKNFEIPDLKKSKNHQDIIKLTKMLKKEKGEEYPIISAVISPFSLPVMQMGFDKYIELIYKKPEMFQLLMEKNKKYTLNWINALKDAGCDSVVYYDPVSSPTILPKKKYLETGKIVQKEMLSKLDIPIGVHFASGLTSDIAEDVIETGAALLGISVNDDIIELKKKLMAR